MYTHQKRRPGRYAWASLLALLLMLAVNAAAVALPLNGYATSTISEMYPNLFTPAGLTFAIWGLLYLCQIGFVAYVFIIDRSATQRHEHPLKAIVPRFVLTCLLNAAWLVAWHYLWISQSLMIMLALLLTLISLYEKLSARRFETLLEAFFIRGTISLYLGWISVAIIANAAAYWVSLKPGGYGLSETWWTLAMIGAAVLLALYFSIRLEDVCYPAVILWALYGIYLRHLAASEAGSELISKGSMAGMGLVALGVVYALYKLFYRGKTA